MTKSLVSLALLLAGCQTTDEWTTSPRPADYVPPPGSQGIVMFGPLTASPGDLIDLGVSAPDVEDGDRVGFAWGTQLGPGRCPMRQHTGGGLCLDITRPNGGGAPLLGIDFATPSLATIQVEVPDTVWDTIYVQAMKVDGANSATSNVLELAIEPGPVCPDTGADQLFTAEFDRSHGTAFFSVENEVAYSTYVYHGWDWDLGGDNYEDTREITFFDANGNDVSTGELGVSMNCTAMSDGPGWSNFNPDFLFDGVAGTYGPQNSNYFNVECSFDGPVVLRRVQQVHFDAAYSDGYRVLYGRDEDGTLYPLPMDSEEPTQGLVGALANLDWNAGGHIVSADRPDCTN